MDFGRSPQQDELYREALAFASSRLNKTAGIRDREHRFGREEWRLCGEFGLQGLCLPTAHGGMGLDMLTSALVLEAAGRGCEDTGLLFSCAAHLFACAVPIAEFGSEALRAAHLPALASGSRIGANAITEAEAGSDVFAMKTRAVRDGADFVLEGTKSYVTNAPVADTFLVYAVTNPAHGYMGISAFVVHKETAGLTVGAPFEKVGLTTSPTSAIYLDACRVSADSLVGAEGQGALIFTSSMHWERACLFAIYIGQMERQLERAVAFAKERAQFGRPIGKHQAIAHKIADMKQRLEAGRLLLYRACWARDQGETATLEVSLAKLAISEAAIRSGLELVQIFGGNGLMTEYGVDRGLRDALASTIFSGTSEIQRDLIAKELGL